MQGETLIAFGSSCIVTLIKPLMANMCCQNIVLASYKRKNNKSRAGNTVRQCHVLSSNHLILTIIAYLNFDETG